MSVKLHLNVKFVENSCLSFEIEQILKSEKTWQSSATYSVIVSKNNFYQWLNESEGNEKSFLILEIDILQKPWKCSTEISPKMVNNFGNPICQTICLKKILANFTEM